LSDFFLELLDANPLLREFALYSPREHALRGSQLAFRHPQAWSISQALIDSGVVGDFRAPDILRVGFSPLYLRFLDVYQAVNSLAAIMASESWREARFQQRARVT
jgi:kynureninase